MNDFTGTTGAHFYGEPFPNDVVLFTVQSLIDHGLIEGDQRATLLLKPRLTTDGHVAVERFGADVVAWVAGPETGGGAYVSVRDSPWANISQNSPQSQQWSHVEVGVSEQLERLATVLETLLSTNTEALASGPTDLARASALVQELREAARDAEHNPGSARRALSTLGEITKGGTSGLLGSALWALALQALSRLG